jgi:hypothetical protein
MDRPKKEVEVHVLGGFTSNGDVIEELHGLRQPKGKKYVQ